MEKNKKNKRILKSKAIFIFFFLVVLILFGLFCIFNNKPETNEENLKYNKNKSFIKEQKIDGISFKNINCTYDGKNSLITYTIVNETSNEIFLSNYDIIVMDKSKKVITKIVASYSENIEPKKKVNMANSVVGVDLSDAYYMELNLKIDKK